MITEVYSPKRFGKLIGRSTQTLQRWDRESILPAKRTPTNRRYYTHEDYLRVRGQAPQERINISYARVSRAQQRTVLHSQKRALELFAVAPA